MREGCALIDERLLCDQRVRYFLKRNQDGLLVLGNCAIPESLLCVVALNQSAALEKRTGETSGDVPDAEARCEDVANISALAPIKRRYADPREEIGHCDADLGVGADHSLFGLHDIGPALKQIRSQANRNSWHGLLGQYGSPFDISRVSTQKDAESILLLNNSAFQAGGVCDTKVVGGLGTLHRKLAVSAELKALRKQIKRLFVS